MRSFAFLFTLLTAPPDLGESQLALLKLIQKNPGIPSTTLEREFGRGSGSYRYNLKRLMAEKLVVMRKMDRLKLVFAASEDVPHRLTPRFGPVKLEIARLIADRPGIDRSDIGSRKSPGWRNRYQALRELIDSGYVRSGSTTRHVNLRPTPKLLRRLESGIDDGP